MLLSGYYITAELKVKDPSKAALAKAELIALCAKTITEAGCTFFRLHQVVDQPERFLLWERFDDEAAFKAHFEQPYTKDYVAMDLTEVVSLFQSNIV